MFGTVIKNLYERFHETSEFQTNISCVVDDTVSDKLGTIVVDLFYNKSYVPIGSFTMHLSIMESGDGKQARLCYLDSIELDKDMLIQDTVTIMTKIQSATSGILKRPENILFKFEKDLTAAGGYLTGFGITDVVYNESMQCFARRVDGPLFKMEVISPDHAHRTYSVDIKAINSTSIDVMNTFSGKFLSDIFMMSSGGSLPDEEKSILENVVTKYNQVSNELDTRILGVIIPYYNTNIAKWYGTISVD